MAVNGSGDDASTNCGEEEGSRASNEQEVEHRRNKNFRLANNNQGTLRGRGRGIRSPPVVNQRNTPSPGQIKQQDRRHDELIR